MTKVNILTKPTPLQLFIFQEQHYPERIMEAKTLAARQHLKADFARIKISSPIFYN